MSFEKIFNKMFLSLIHKIQAELLLSNKILPSKKKQKSIIEECKSIKCNARFIVTMGDYNIVPLFRDDPNFPFEESPISVNHFLKEIVHPSFLIPYLVYAELAYTLYMELSKVELEQLLEMEYHIQIPLKLRKTDKHYRWYTQKSVLLTVNEKNQIISHINIYEQGSKMLRGERPEKRFIEATIFQDQAVHEYFQDLLEKKRKEFYLSENILLQKHMDLLMDNVKYKKYYKDDLRKEVLDILEQFSGYRFLNLKEAKMWLIQEGIIKEEE